MADPMDLDDLVGYQPPVLKSKAELAKELDEKYPNRPRNHSETLPFASLFQDLFNPLNENKLKLKGPAGRRFGPGARQNSSPHEIRRAIIERFLSRWRQSVGDDIFPAFRLILPEKDRERAMYGLKEAALGKLFVNILQIDKNSDDGFALLKWKVPGQSAATRMAGDFAGRCYVVISKRPQLNEVGNMTIEEVNEKLDLLSAASKEKEQLPILKEFYNRMNAEELMWLTRIILRQMKVGATERTFFDIWHPDAESLFNISSNLRRVCWELHNPSLRLETEERGVTLMQCFQPQLAQFHVHSLEKMVQKLGVTDDDKEFWIEEKLDGERMQLHMVTDEETRGGKRFGFWSRKAKDYTYLYGEGFDDDESALTRHLRRAFQDGVENIILDGEMITWDPEIDKMVPFGSLKTAAISEQKNPYAFGQRPLFRVFDILYLNNTPLTKYALRERRKALERSVVNVHRRLELHPHIVATKADEIEPHLRQVVAEASEGLVLKSPRSSYHLNQRNDDWVKVKPGYMKEFGDSLDCLVLGGYYGSGKRGGDLASFLCGLRVDESSKKAGDSRSELFYSFFKVGGGLSSSDYASIRHLTEGKWIKYDSKNPPTDYFELGGGTLQYERPDVWIKPGDSFVIEAKAAEPVSSKQFRVGITLRFPRFTKLRSDKDWQSALSIEGFEELKIEATKKQQEEQFQLDDSRKKKRKITSKRKAIEVAGYGMNQLKEVRFEKPSGQVFTGTTFYVLTGSTVPEKKSKPELEALIKANGGTIVQTAYTDDNTICVAERGGVKVASLEKRGEVKIIRPTWIFDCIVQSAADFAKGRSEFPIPYELERHIYFIDQEGGEKAQLEGNVDEYGDSYARDTSVDELRRLMETMGDVTSLTAEGSLKAREAFGEVPGWLFHGTTLFFDPIPPGQANGETAESQSDDGELAKLRRRLQAVTTTATFAGAETSTDLDNNKKVTHVVVHERSDLSGLRKQISTKFRFPRVVTLSWIESSWAEKTLLDAERFVPAWG